MAALFLPISVGKKSEHMEDGNRGSKIQWKSLHDSQFGVNTIQHLIFITTPAPIGMGLSGTDKAESSLLVDRATLVQPLIVVSPSEPFQKETPLTRRTNEPY